MFFEAEFVEADGSSQRIDVVVPRSNHDLDGVTRQSRVLIGGRLRSADRPYIIAQASTILCFSPNDENERASPRVHDVEAHWRLLRSGKRVRVQAHSRGRTGLVRLVKNIAATQG